MIRAHYEQPNLCILQVQQAFRDRLISLHLAMRQRSMEVLILGLNRY